VVRLSAPEIVVERSPDYRTIVVNGVFGGHRPGFFEAILYTDEMVTEEALRSASTDPSRIKVKRTTQCRFVMDPIQAKAFATWLQHHITEYERDIHQIPTGGPRTPGSPAPATYG
jgi:hypothetical protein